MCPLIRWHAFKLKILIAVLFFTNDNSMLAVSIKSINHLIRRQLNICLRNNRSEPEIRIGLRVPSTCSHLNKLHTNKCATVKETNKNRQLGASISLYFAVMFLKRDLRILHDFIPKRMHFFHYHTITLSQTQCQRIETKNGTQITYSLAPYWAPA